MLEQFQHLKNASECTVTVHSSESEVIVLIESALISTVKRKGA